MRFGTTRSIIAALAVAASIAGAQVPPPIRPLGPVTATATEKLVGVTGVVQLSDGRVLVNDGGARRLVLLDSMLTNSMLVADSAAGAANAYGTRAGLLISYRADSSLLVDGASLSMLVIDPAGKMGRVKAVPRTQDAGYMSTTVYGLPTFDATGRLVYRVPGKAPPAPPVPRGAISLPQQPDSYPVIRVDLVTRRVDTLGSTKMPKTIFIATQTASGGLSLTTQQNPLPLVDEWAVLSDGSVAFVRGQDYHVDWFNADGTRSSSPKMPFDWQRLTPPDKVAFVDSAKTALEKTRAAAFAAAIKAGTVSPTTVLPPINFVPPSQLPDYKPPFSTNSIRADADDNLWIRTIPTKAISGGLVYDIVNRRGELTDRVQLPANSTIVGFGHGGVIYLAGRDPTGYHLLRARVK